MPHNPDQLSNEYDDLKAQTDEFALASQRAQDTRDPNDIVQAKQLKASLEQRKNELKEKLWPFESLGQVELERQVEDQSELCSKAGILETLSDGQEGIRDERGNEYPFPSKQEIAERMLDNRELLLEKTATFKNPLVLITPFALDPKELVDRYAQQIEEHFVEDKTTSDPNIRFPNPERTRLHGVDGEPLELRKDGQNVKFNPGLNSLSYFPEWEAQGSNVKPTNGITKEQALDLLGGWKISLVENIPLAPERGQGETITKQVKFKDGTKEITRKQVEGGKRAAEQYQLLKQQNEADLTIEDQIFHSMYYLETTDSVLDDDRKTNYCCRIIGNANAHGGVPHAYWRRRPRQAALNGDRPVFSDSFICVRPAVRISKP